MWNEDPRFAADMAAYFDTKGQHADGTPISVEVEGWSKDWSYSEYTGGTDHHVRVIVRYDTGTPSTWSADHNEIASRELDDFDLADFMQFVYSRLPARAAGA